MDVKTTEYKRVAVVQPVGRVDSNTSAEFEAELRRLVDSGHINLVLDLSKIDFLSSAGLRVIVSTMKSTRKNGGNICVAEAKARAAEVMKLAGLDSVIDMHPTREAAIASF